MKRKTLVTIIFCLVTFLATAAAAIYMLRKRGIIFIDGDCDCEFDEDSDELDDLEGFDRSVGGRIKRFARRFDSRAEEDASDAEDVREGEAEDAKSDFGF